MLLLQHHHTSGYHADHFMSPVILINTFCFSSFLVLSDTLSLTASGS
jgi:hypothetical protein